MDQAIQDNAWALGRVKRWLEAQQASNHAYSKQSCILRFLVLLFNSSISRLTWVDACNLHNVAPAIIAGAGAKSLNPAPIPANAVGVGVKNALAHR